MAVGETTFMPQATNEQRARWPGSDQQAIKFLEDAGYVLTRNWKWIIPKNHKPTEREYDAMDYMCNEWDFGGFENNQ